MSKLGMEFGAFHGPFFGPLEHGNRAKQRLPSSPDNKNYHRYKKNV
jgi:hypothetical protein